MKRDHDSQTGSLFDKLLPTGDFKVEGNLIELSKIIPPDPMPPPDPDLLKQVKEWGVLQPILVRPKGKKFQIIAGRRRWLSMMICASQKAEYKDLRAAMLKEDSAVHEPFIPAGVVTGLADDASAAVITLVENAARKSNMDSECAAIVSLIECGASTKEITRLSGFSAAEIKQRLTLRELDPYLHEMLVAGKITQSLALAAAKLPKEWQKKLSTTAYKRIAQDDGIKRALTNDDVREVKQVRSSRALDALGEQSDLFIDMVEDSDPALDGAETEEHYRLVDWKPRARFHLDELKRLLSPVPEQALGLAGLVGQADEFLRGLEAAAALAAREEAGGSVVVGASQDAVIEEVSENGAGAKKARKGRTKRSKKLNSPHL